MNKNEIIKLLNDNFLPITRDLVVIDAPQITIVDDPQMVGSYGMISFYLSLDADEFKNLPKDISCCKHEFLESIRETPRIFVCFLVLPCNITSATLIEWKKPKVSEKEIQGEVGSNLDIPDNKKPCLFIFESTLMQDLKDICIRSVNGVLKVFFSYHGFIGREL